jgi:hypothetical protein
MLVLRQRKKHDCNRSVAAIEIVIILQRVAPDAAATGHSQAAVDFRYSRRSQSLALGACSGHVRLAKIGSGPAS